MTESKSGFSIRFASARALQREYDLSLSKGGMLVPWSGPPAEKNTTITLRVEAPDGTSFDFEARVGQPIPGLGFTVSFVQDKDEVGKSPIDLFMRDGRMKAAVAAERPGSAPKEPVVQPFSEDSPKGSAEGADRTDPLLAFSPSDLPDEALGDPTHPGDLNDAAPVGDTLATEAQGEVAGAREDELEVLSPDGTLPTGFRKPEAGEEYLVYVVKYSTVRAFAEIRDRFRSTQRLQLTYSEAAEHRGKVVELRLTLPGHNVYKMLGILEKVGESSISIAFDENNEQFRKACLFVDSGPARSRLKNEVNLELEPPSIVRLMDKVPEEDASKMPIRRRLQRMGMDDKINLALSGGREERMALAMDGNKAIHHFLLRNAKISLDEIAFMARLPGLNPDVLDKIAENPAYTQNPTVVKALVYNPKTPVLTAIRLLDRLPRPELMNLAKRMNMNQRLIMAAKKKVEGSKI